MYLRLGINTTKKLKKYISKGNWKKRAGGMGLNNKIECDF